MRVHKPKVEYKLAIQENLKGAYWRIVRELKNHDDDRKWDSVLRKRG